MYSQPPFKMFPQERLKLISRQPFGLLTTCREGLITQAFLPFLFDHVANCLYGHLAKNNPQIEALTISQDLGVTFQGEHAYISPNWYKTKEQVPTWNYQAVEVKGKATLLNTQETLEVITQLSNQHESQFDIPWAMDKLPQKKIDAMLRAISGFKIGISEINGINKMSQNKNEQDREFVVRELLNQPDQASKGVANIMGDIMRR